MTKPHGCEVADKCVYDLRCPHSANCWLIERTNEVRVDPGTRVVLGPPCELTSCPMAGTIHGHGVGIEMGYA